MSKTEDNNSSSALSADALLFAMLTLMIDERERAAGGNPGQAKTEVLLASAGLSYQQIAAIMNKNPDAVRMMLSRMRKADKKSAAKKGVK